MFTSVLVAPDVSGHDHFGSAEASRSPLTVLRTSRIPAVGACCFPAILPPTLVADRSVSPLPPNYRPPGNRLLPPCLMVVYQLSRHVQPDRIMLLRVQLKVTHPSNASISASVFLFFSQVVSSPESFFRRILGLVSLRGQTTSVLLSCTSLLCSLLSVSP